MQNARQVWQTQTQAQAQAQTRRRHRHRHRRRHRQGAGTGTGTGTDTDTDRGTDTQQHNNVHTCLQVFKLPKGILICFIFSSWPCSIPFTCCVPVTCMQAVCFTTGVKSLANQQSQGRILYSAKPQEMIVVIVSSHTNP